MKKNFLFLVLLLLLIIPQSRKQIQILFHKGIALINPINKIEPTKRQILENYSFKLINENGIFYDFENAKGKVILINFWATWCQPCIAEMPSLEKLYQHYKNDIVFLFVTSDDMSKASDFKKDKSYSFPVYNSEERFVDEFQVTSIPRTLLINKKGEIIVDESGAADWFSAFIQDQIKQLIEED